MDDRSPVFNVRTTKMSDGMYAFVEKRIQEMPQKTFREYAFQLIERDIASEKEIELGKEKNRHVYDELLDLRHKMENEFKQLNKKIEGKLTLAKPNTLAAHQKDAKDNISPLAEKEGQLVSDEITGTIDEDYNIDF
ncbi:hypothetical protein EV207_12515 [Scopulibacillus darangshiensis]|uniref:Uncharacterized protein n=1 Tax=Scopulibacillus darangshiensis TaxID=442528 RepID=A0A4R2NST3_9BACL|nr:hypothetical protein [Scopulibacillus darangshiensis]TCP24455.1 hypothetical protein EV207_12515 [Scopulibacillus darangshiensis]